MIERNGRTYQTGNGIPITPKRILRALCMGGEANGVILKGKQFIHWKVLEGNLRPQKEYYQSFTDLSLVNPDVIMENDRKELCFLYGV